MIWGHTYNFSGTRWTTILQTRARRLRASHFCCEFANLNQIKKLENFVFRIPSCTASISYIFIHFIYSSIHFHHWIKSFHLIKALCIFIGPESDHWLTNWLTPWCLVNLIDATLACKDANSKLVEVVTVADVDAGNNVGNSLLQFWELMFGPKAKLSFRL